MCIKIETVEQLIIILKIFMLRGYYWEYDKEHSLIESRFYEDVKNICMRRKGIYLVIHRLFNEITYSYSSSERLANYEFNSFMRDLNNIRK